MITLNKHVVPGGMISLRTMQTHIGAYQDRRSPAVIFRTGHLAATVASSHNRAEVHLGDDSRVFARDVVAKQPRR